MRLLWVVLTMTATAGFASTPIDYKDGDTTLQGALATPKNPRGKLPVVLIVHDWNGIDAYEEGRADQIAGLGYIGLAIDIYGKGVRPKNPQESSAEAGKYYRDNALLRSRVRAALELAKTLPNADPTRMAIIGYCFGGMTALDTARSGADLLGAVSFHGGFRNLPPVARGAVRAKVLVLHGDADTASPLADVEAFQKQMKDAGAEVKVVIYHGAKHAFTVPGSEKMGAPGVGYDAKADKASWGEMRKFLKSLFGA